MVFVYCCLRPNFALGVAEVAEVSLVDLGSCRILPDSRAFLSALTNMSSVPSALLLCWYLFQAPLIFLPPQPARAVPPAVWTPERTRFLP